MEQKVYPDLEAMCRLCLKENAGTVCIFNNGENSEKCASLSIPMRIMTCASIEVHNSAAFPKKICCECRFQLEKSYYFRKLSQASDAKLKKHLRLIGMGKSSKVFDKKLEEDDYEELEFHDSLNFIKEHENYQKQVDKLKIDSYMDDIKLQNEQYLKQTEEKLKATCREQLIPEIKDKLRREIEAEIKKKFEDDIRKEVSEQCITKAKESLRSEVLEECRQLEMKYLLDDLQIYLINKNKSLDSPVQSNTNIRKKWIPSTSNEITQKIQFIPQKPQKIEVVGMELEVQDMNTEKGYISTENNKDHNTNVEECDSEGNFLIYDSEEGYEVQKKSLGDKFDYVANAVQEDIEYEEFGEDNIVTFEKISVDNLDTNEESAETTSTTSYRIEDNEDGEIQFLKKCSNDTNNSNDVENRDQKYDYKNIMFINMNDGIENEYVEHFEEVEQKQEKIDNKSPKKNKTSTTKKAQASMVTRTTTSETTLLTKTYVNPMQRCTDTPKIFKCYDCPMVFSTKPSLERHLRSHRKVEKTGVKFQCPECHIVVSCSSALRRHMYVHYEKKFICKVCDKAFVQKEILKRHMITHTGIKPFKCPHCERSFVQRINLTHHINRTHLPEPKIQLHSCYLCPKSFNHASGLSRHLASHNGVAFQCSECDRTFGDRSSIKRHIANMHGSRSLKAESKTKAPDNS